MTQTTESTRSRTATLPPHNKSLLQVRHLQARVNARGSSGESAGGLMTFGPYLVPLSRRAE